MKIYTLMENTASTPDFAAEHGLSFYIETGKHKILFDSGQSTGFIKNAAQLNIDLQAVDIFILSHGHYDHGGGLQAFLELNDSAAVYINKYAFGDYFAEDGRYIGLDKTLQSNDRITLCDGTVAIDDNITLTSCNEHKQCVPVCSYGLNAVENGQTLPDRFLHEQYLTIVENNKKIVFSGCSHKGILNIVTWLQPDILIGGFHFMKLDCSNQQDAQTLTAAATALSAQNTTYYTCHCTGTEQYAYLKELMQDKLHYLSSGSILEL